METIYTPERIKHLDDNEIFVFGSNLNGNHWGGAARIALELFGAVWGVGEGLTGQSYALPTLDRNMKPLTLDDLGSRFLTLIRCAEENPHLKFYLTKVGCGIAGFKVSQVADVWNKAVSKYPRKECLKRIIIPKEFDKVKNNIQN